MSLENRIANHRKKFWFQKFFMAPLITFFAALIINYASIELNQFWAAWFYAVPFLLFPIIVTLYYYPLPGTSNQNAVAGLCGTTAIGLIILGVWLVILYLLLTYTEIGFWGSMSYAFLAWGIFSIIYFFVMCGSPLVKKLGYLDNCINVGGDLRAT